MALPSMTIQDCSPRLLKKVEALRNVYSQKFHAEPAFYVRCPGRVNLIGEHLDYNKFAVLPIAIEHDIVVAVGSNDEKLNIINYDESYPQIMLSFDKIPDEADLKSLQWYHYIIAGILAIAKKYKLVPKLNILVYGTIPVAAGLSSSSALVCAAAMATVFHYGLHKKENVGKQELSEICAVGEQYIGTKGGGMDQAIIFNGQEGFATKIDFYPVFKVQNICLPSEVTFIVAHSGIRVEKAATNVFNKRVAECLLGVKMLAHLTGHRWTNVSNLVDLQTSSGMSLDEMMKFAKLKMSEVYTGGEICKSLGIDVAELEVMLKGFQLDSLAEEKFEILKRLRHIIQEVTNVRRFIEACKVNNLTELGQAMNDSHRSLRDNYACSHPRLDALVECAVQNGALGARLTGAGWGGCIVAAATKEKQNVVENALRSYAHELGLPDDLVFVTSPCQGASIIENTADMDGMKNNIV